MGTMQLKIINLQSKEPLVRIELTTSSLPRKCSTPELQRLVKQMIVDRCKLTEETICHPSSVFCHLKKSGRRGSNPRPIAWKAIALPTELLPHFYC